MSTNLNEADEVYDLDAARRARVAAPEAAESTNATDAASAARVDSQAVPERSEDAHETKPEASNESDPADEEESEPPTVDGEVLAVRDERPKHVQRAGAPRREVLPAWAKDRESAKAAARWAAGHYGHASVYHGVRLPVYYGKLSARSPIGLGRVVAAWWCWIFDTTNRESRLNVRGNTTDAGAYLRLTQDHRNQVKVRLFLAFLALLALAGVAAFVVYGIESRLVQVVIGLGALAGLGLLGMNQDNPIAGRAVDSAKEPRLTSDLILGAFCVLGIPLLRSSIEKDSRSVAFVSPIHRDGAGWRAEIDLPPGVTAGEVIDKRDKLASGLRRDIGKVWPEADTEVHAGRLVLYIADKAISKAKPTPWPLTKAGKVNLFEPIPIGVDHRGREITTTLMFVSVLIGAVPRMGKTFLLRLLMLAAALDPRVKLYIFDLKGGGDWGPLRHVAHAFRLGDEVDDLVYILAKLKELHTEMRRRYRIFRTLPFEVCPESKVTDDLASDKSLDLGPIVVALDECGLAFGDSTYGKEITEITADLVKRGPAAGIIVIPATQRIDSTSVPTAISSAAALRFALKVMGHDANDMILGSGMYKAGVRATMFGLNDKGVCLMAGEGDEPIMLRGAYVDAADAEKIALRAHAARKAAGLLTGAAAGEEDQTADETGSIIDHLLAVWPENDPEWPNGKVWCEELAARLAASQPGLYEGWTGEQVTSAVKPHRIRPVQVKKTLDGKPANKRGLVRRDLTDTLGLTEPPTP